MPTSYTRHRVEIPLDLYHAINQAAADAGMPTSALATGCENAGRTSRCVTRTALAWNSMSAVHAGRASCPMTSPWPNSFGHPQTAIRTSWR